MTVFTKGGMVYLAREIAQSGDPAKHARDVVDNAIRHQMVGVCLQIDPVNTLEGVPKLLWDACVARGAPDLYGTWAQGMDPAEELEMIRAYGSRYHGLNHETAEETLAYLAYLDDFVALGLPGGLASIITQGAFEGGAVGTAWRFIDAGIDVVPESDPATGTPVAVGIMAANYGWPWSRIAVMCHLDRADASWFGPQLRGDAGSGSGGLDRWSVWTYGNIDNAEWAEIDTWPRPEYVPPPPPPPDPVLPKMTVMQGHAHTRYGVQAVRNQIAPQKLGKAASLTSQDRLALGAISGAHTTEKGQRIAALLDELGYPEV